MKEFTIGLEIHCQINSKQKLFSFSSNNDENDIPNSNINYIDIAIPGTLPLINKFCIQQAIKTGLALNGKINLISKFDRKNYFYPDLPLGYQITQYFHPIVTGGFIELSTGKKIGINRIHIEADAGQNIHKNDYSLVNFNRAMVGLMEIVTEPEINSIEECLEFLKKLKRILKYISTCNGDMEKGNFRVDVNISLNKNENELGTRVEIKNLNSFSFIGEAIKVEINRQKEILLNKKEVIEETRGFNSDDFTTYSLRKKEKAPEYRYMVEPNLPKVVLTEAYVKKIFSSLEELPDSKYKRYINYGLETNVVEIFLENLLLQNYFEDILKKNLKNNLICLISNWIIGDLYGLGNKLEKCISTYPKEYLISIVEMIEKEKISGKIGKFLLEKSWQENLNPLEIVEKENLWQITDENLIKKYIEEIKNEFPEKIKEYKEKKDERILHFLVGNIIKKTKGKAAPTICYNLLINYINNN